MKNHSVISLKNKIIPLAKKYQARKVALFGSVLSSEFKRDSDIDILVDLPGDKSLLDLVALRRALSEVLEREADVVTYKSLHPALRQRILQSQHVIYERRI